ncbi:hypothetical protein AwWohl_07380 [Gammaproteobacteria bacterium]|nr:hypothetical protein AwWohl_07380 [Gammaproteobacteria bacterium]
MHSQLLLAYVKNTSLSISVKRADSIKPRLTLYLLNDRAEFMYRSTSKVQYNMTIYQNNSIISSRCTCGYPVGGICEHVIACINMLIIKNEYNDKNKGNILKVPIIKKAGIADKLKKDQLILEETNPKTTKLKKGSVYLPDHLITKNILSIYKEKSRVRYYDSPEIESVTTTRIAFSYNKQGYSASLSLVFDYKPAEQYLHIECSCSDKSGICEHMYTCLEEVVKVLGYDFFEPSYMDNKIDEHLLSQGMTRADDYEAFFFYHLNTNGFIAKSKYKNIVDKVKPLLPMFENEVDSITMALPYQEKAVVTEIGLGFCFTFSSYSRHSSDEAILMPVLAKYNKSKADFASGFKKIDFYTLHSALFSIQKQDEQLLITKVLQINGLILNYVETENISSLKRGLAYFNEIFPALKSFLTYHYNDYNNLIRKNLTPITLSDLSVELSFALTDDPHFYNFKAQILIGDDICDIGRDNMLITPLFIYMNHTIYPIKTAELSLYLKHFNKQPEANYHKKDFNEVYQRVLLPLSKKFKVSSPLFKLDSGLDNNQDNDNLSAEKVLKKAKRTIKKIEISIKHELEKHVYMADADEMITFKLATQYQSQLIEIGSNEMLLAHIINNEIVYMPRDKEFEDGFLEEFKALHPDFESQQGIYFLHPEQLMEKSWILHSADKMKDLGIKVFGANTLKSFKFNLNKASIHVDVKSDIDWFDVEIKVSFGNEKVGLRAIQQAFLKKTNYIELGDGTLGILPEEWMRKFEHYFKAGSVKKDSIQLSNYQFGIIDELFDEMETKPPFILELLEKKRRLQNITHIDPVAIPKGIKAKLRDYQHHGLNWLNFLDKNQLGGCLADDMGLGKTIQTIAFLQHLKLTKSYSLIDKTSKSAPPSLIIAPTSLIFNWKNEIDQFCPSLKMLIFVGSNRLEHKDDFSKYDVIISTYGSLLNDIEFMKDIRFHYVILDESQAIKNPNSQRYKSVKLLNSYNRLVLTGTPIQNNTFDLYAQMNFVNPGLLGNMNHFRKQFSDLIDKEKDYDTSILLGKMIAPFILRRTKEQVAKELPEKIENIIFCEMGVEQRRVYDSFKDKYRDYLINQINENGAEKSQMYILEGLTKLRQICNSSALISDDADYGNYSIKLDVLMETIQEKTSDHKILVFSQFVKMLHLVRNRLDDAHIQYEYLDGQTRNREECVNNFQTNKGVRVFLISLKAGGVGLNLTEADYVFLIDPWWNPAVESQAIDRCYRIGQKKAVMAYRMICKDTIEEKIVLLQGNKKRVASSIIQIDEDKKTFDLDVVKDFFS